MLVIPIITPFTEPTKICAVVLSWYGSLIFILRRYRTEFDIKIKAIKNIIKEESKIFKRYAPGKIKIVEKIKKYFVSFNIFLKFPPLLNWYIFTIRVGIKIRAIIIFISITKDNKEMETVGIPKPILPLINPQRT